MKVTRAVVVIGGLALLAAACGDAAEPGTGVPAATQFAPTTVATTVTTVVPEAPDPGPQEGESPWRLLADETRGRPYTVSVASSQASIDRMWEYFGFEAATPTIDVDREVVVLFTQAVSPSCPDVVLADVVIEEARVFATYGYPTEYSACNDDASPHSFVVAVNRAALPDSFTLALAEDLVCGGCDADLLEVDLTDPEFDSALWGFGRVLVVREGPALEFPEISMGFVTPSYGLVQSWVLGTTRGDSELVHAIDPASGGYIIDAGRADCPDDDCGDDPPDLTDPCRTVVTAVPGADVWVVYTVDGSGQCTWMAVDGYELPDYPDEG